VAELKKLHAYGGRVAGQNGGVAGGGKTPPPPLTREMSATYSRGDGVAGTHIWRPREMRAS
jgi:hypothetical protein